MNTNTSNLASTKSTSNETNLVVEVVGAKHPSFGGKSASNETNFYEFSPNEYWHNITLHTPDKNINCCLVCNTMDSTSELEISTDEFVNIFNLMQNGLSDKFYITVEYANKDKSTNRMNCNLKNIKADNIIDGVAYFKNIKIKECCFIQEDTCKLKVQAFP